MFSKVRKYLTPHLTAGHPRILVECRPAHYVYGCHATLVTSWPSVMYRTRKASFKDTLIIAGVPPGTFLACVPGSWLRLYFHVSSQTISRITSPLKICWWIISDFVCFCLFVCLLLLLFCCCFLVSMWRAECYAKQKKSIQLFNPASVKLTGEF